jgi:hypothetical protein
MAKHDAGFFVAIRAEETERRRRAAIFELEALTEELEHYAKSKILRRTAEGCRQWAQGLRCVLKDLQGQ